MNSIQDKINLIKQSIEDEKGREVRIEESDHEIGFMWYEDGNPDERSIWIDKSFLELLPLSLPNKEGWIAVGGEKPKQGKKYELCYEIDPYDRGSAFGCWLEGRWTITDTLVANVVMSGHAKITHYRERTPLPPAPVKIKE